MNLDLELLELQEASQAPEAKDGGGRCDEALREDDTLGVLLVVRVPTGRQEAQEAEIFFADAMNRVLKKITQLVGEKGDALQVSPRCCFFSGFLSELLQGYFRAPHASWILGELVKCFDGVLSVLKLHEADSTSDLKDLSSQVDLAFWGASQCLEAVLQEAVLAADVRDRLTAALRKSEEADNLIDHGQKYGGRVMKTTAASAVKMMEELRSVFETEAFLSCYEELRRAARPGQTAHAEFVLDVQRTVIPQYGFSADSFGVRDMREELVYHHLVGANNEVGRLRRDLDLLLGQGEKCVSVADERQRVREDVASSQGRAGRLPCAREDWISCDASEARVQRADGVCIVTQCSVDRLGCLEELLACWPGDVSAAVYVDGAPGGETARAAREAVMALCRRVASNEGRGLQRWSIVAVYRLEDSEVRCPAYDRLYPVNTLRNAALERARAGLVLLVDVDFVPSEALHSVLCGDDRGERLRQVLAAGSGDRRGPLALVVPAFEEMEGSSRPLPRDGASLRAACRAGAVEGFHMGSFPRGHRATDFPRWLAGLGAGAGASDAGFRLQREVHGVDAYSISYEEQYEPYVVVDRSVVPAYDERFRGYGMNKASHLYELNARRFGFVTLDHSDAFLISRRHEPSESRRQYAGKDADASHRARVAAHYAAFKSDLRLKLLGLI